MTSPSEGDDGEAAHHTQDGLLIGASRNGTSRTNTKYEMLLGDWQELVLALTFRGEQLEVVNWYKYEGIYIATGITEQENT